MKPSLPKGTRDFSPQEMVRRNYIFDTIKQVYQRYGFLPIETPAMETLKTLTGKYGDEGDNLIFKILPRGEKLKGLLQEFETTQKIYNKENSKKDKNIQEELNDKTLTAKNVNEFIVDFWAKDISEEALRYDLTVPFARYVVMNQHNITFPFKRYQIQPVWRAERPQKGRYREFYQCDADVIGSNSLLNEVELVQIMDEVYTSLKIPVTIKINNRKILSGIAGVIGEEKKIIDITVAIDKLDKIGIEKVNEELRGKGVSEKAIQQLQPVIELKGNTSEKFEVLRKMFSGSEIGKKGIEEIEYIFNTLTVCKLQTAKVELDITLARGLNYYTGAIFEVKANAGTLTSSICGGGRYDDLTGIFGLPNVSGVGISFGADRIYDVLNELNLFPPSIAASTKLLIVNFGSEEENFCLPLLQKIRAAGIRAEIYPEAVKMKKQMSYADAKSIPYVLLVGSEEMKTGNLTLKSMSTGEQEKVSVENLIAKLKA